MEEKLLKKKVRIVKDENGVTWRKEYSKRPDGTKSIVSTKIAGFRYKIESQKSRGVEITN